MENLRLVMFGLLSICLIVGITPYWSASASPTATGDRISAQNLSVLNDLIKATRTDANRTYWENCSVSPQACSKQYNSLSTTSDLPFCVCDRNQSQKEVLHEQYKVCNEFAQLLDEFIEDVSGDSSSSQIQLLSNLTTLRNNSLKSVIDKFQVMKLDSQKGSTVAKINTSQNLHQRNFKNLRIVARMATEMDKMSKVLPSLQ